ncbi:hypothetical protein [Hyphococcus sp.]|uniref:hypothetical protein n=1 Tax=Hyphococcus sp. TaxID=2038636 RepID=UPI003CCC30C6
MARFEEPSHTPEVVAGYGGTSDTVLKMFENGYGLIGYSAFNGPIEKSKKALSKAREIGATKVVLLREHTDTIQGAYTINGTKAVTTQHNGMVSAYGSGGYASGSYWGTSTSYVPTQTQIPYSVSRYDQTALFFGPLKTSCVGVMLSEPSEQEKRLVDTNQVVKIAAVRKDSAAYQADIIPGDLIATAGDKGIYPEKPNFGMSSGEPHTIRLARGRRIVEVKLLPQNCS